MIAAKNATIKDKVAEIDQKAKLLKIANETIAQKNAELETKTEKLKVATQQTWSVIKESEEALARQSQTAQERIQTSRASSH